MYAQRLTSGASPTNTRTLLPKRTPHNAMVTQQPRSIRELPGYGLQPSIKFRRVRMLLQRQAIAPSESEKATEPVEEEKSSNYSQEMQNKMGGDLVYRHEAGINYHKILDDLYVGSCLQTALDVDHVREKLGIGSVICLQQDSDMAYFQLDIDPILKRCIERGDIKHYRVRINDFDPFSLRLMLPQAVKTLQEAAASGRGPVYIHCTAGLGRAPAVAMSWMYWCKGFSLKDAVEKLVAIRRCNPKIASIRQATVDVLYGEPTQPVSLKLYRHGGAKSVQVAGLDVGWGQFLDLSYDPHKNVFALDRELLPGRYQYKFIIDGHWTYDANHPTTLDGNNTNNILEVVGEAASPDVLAARKRLMAEDGDLTPEEREKIEELMGVNKGKGMMMGLLQMLWPFGSK